MFPGPELYALFLLLAVIPAAYLTNMVWDRRNGPGVRWFILMLVGKAGWAVCWGLMILFDGYWLSLASFNVLLLFVSLTVVGWLFVTVEYIWQTRVNYRVVAPFLVIPVLTQVLAWSNSLHHLVWRPGTAVAASGVIVPAKGIWSYVHVGYSYLLVAAAGVLLVGTLADREGMYRKQTLILILGWTIPVLSSVGYMAGLLPEAYLNPTPIAFLVGAVIWGWGLYRYRLLEAVPIARRTALDEMNEGVLIVDERGVITDWNPAAREILGLQDDPTGKPLRALDSITDDLQCGLGDSTAMGKAATISRDGEQRHVTINKTRIGDDELSIGEVIVFNDQTDLIRYEQDLELLKEVLARVLRHDFRNKLNVIRAHGEMLANLGDEQYAEQARTIVRTSDRILETSEKARVIGSLVEADRQLYDEDLAQIVTEVVGWAENQYPDVTIEADTPQVAWVRADEALSLAVRSLVENALEHNDSSDPRVSITVERDTDTVRLAVEDNGPGMDPQERKIFSNRTIDQLNHSTGLGLWLVNWVVQNSGAEVDIEITETGTRVAVELHRSFDRPATAATEASTSVDPS